MWISGVGVSQSYGIKELGSSDLHILNGGALQSSLVTLIVAWPYNLPERGDTT